MSHDAVVIVSASRTPIGSLQGVFQDLTAPELGATVIRAAVERATLSPNDVQDVIMGCVLPAGQGQAPARQAALAAGLPSHVPCTTINKMCGSGLKAIMLTHDALLAGSVDVAIAGGMESMTQAPYLLKKARGGYRLGHGQLYDHMFLDGLEDAYEKGQLMGCFAEATAKHYGLTREAQDAFAITSLKRAQQATQSGAFAKEIVPVTLKTREGESQVHADEQLQKAKPEKIPQLKPAFAKDGTVTAANSSSISDGASAVLLMRASDAARRGLTPLAKIIAHTSFAQDPPWFTTAPIGAIQALLKKTQWSIDSVDLFEINEAFAVVTLAAIKELHLNPEQVNVHGGACALGHPIGASGARIVTTLVSALHHYQKQRGIAALCIGGGEAVAVAIELF